MQSSNIARDMNRLLYKYSSSQGPPSSSSSLDKVGGRVDTQVIETAVSSSSLDKAGLSVATIFIVVWG